MSQTPVNGLFSLLPERRPPWKEFVFSFGVETVAIVIVAWIGVLHPNVLRAPIHDYHFVQLVPTPAPMNHEPAPERMIPAPVMARVPTPAPALKLPPQDNPQISAPKVEIAETKPAPVEAAQPVIPRRLVKTDVFSTGSSAPPT